MKIFQLYRSKASVNPKNITLRRKIIYLFITTGIALAVIMSLVAMFIVKNNFTKLENSTVELSITRVNNLISTCISNLDKPVSRWAQSDDTYTFMKDHNERYENSNLVESTFTSLKINLLALIDVEGKPVWVGTYDLKNNDFVDTSPSIYYSLEDNGVINYKGSEAEYNGIISLPDGPMLFCSSPIVTSSGGGPSMGTLIMGQYLDSEVISDISKTADLDISSFSFNGNSLPAKVREFLSTHDTMVTPINSNFVAGYLRINDIHNRPIAAVKVEMPRIVYAKGRATLLAFYIGIILIASAFLLINLSFMEKTVLKRLRTLTGAVVTAGQTGDFHFDINMEKAHDELSVLAGEINNMTIKLTESRNALKDSEKKYSLLVEQNNNGILIIQNGVVQYANSAIAAILNIPQSEIVGHPFEEFITPANTELLTKNYLARISGSSLPDKYEVNFLRNDNSEINLEISGKLIEINGNACDMVVVHDITHRKLSEKLLQLQKDLIDRILATTPNAVIAVDSENKIFYANQAFYKVFKPEALSVNEMPLKSIFREDRLLPVVNRVRTGIQTQEKIDFSYKAGSSTLTLAADVMNMRNGEVLLIIRDVTEERENQDRLYLTSRLVSIGEMASGIAHELNNPLTSIVGLSRLLLDDHIPAEIEEDIKGINNEAQRAAAVVKNLLTFVRNHPRQKNLIQMNKVIEDVLKLRAHEHKVNNIQVTTMFDPVLPEVVADYYQMQQVFLNIILNAESAMVEAHQQGRLIITTEKIEGGVRILFSDDGPGIKPENLARIFDPFFTTKDIGKGTGLGLSICHSIINSHGGRIYARSTGNGATFIIELPEKEDKTNV